MPVCVTLGEVESPRGWGLGDRCLLGAEATDWLHGPESPQGLESKRPKAFGDFLSRPAMVLTSSPRALRCIGSYVFLPSLWGVVSPPLHPKVGV